MLTIIPNAFDAICCLYTSMLFLNSYNTIKESYNKHYYNARRHCSNEITAHNQDHYLLLYKEAKQWPQSLGKF